MIISFVTLDHRIPRIPNINLSTVHRASWPATARATARKYPQSRRIYRASILFNSTKWVLATPMDRKENKEGSSKDDMADENSR
jgi:hypothetical protein